MLSGRGRHGGFDSPRFTSRVRAKYRETPTYVPYNAALGSASVILSGSSQFCARRYLSRLPLDENEIDRLIQLDDVLYEPSSNRNKDKVVRQQQAQIPPPSKATSGILEQRAKLPVSKQYIEIVHALRNNQVTLITGGTGSGKTTQVPQFLLEEANKNKERVRIICTQPRRLPAISVAERVAQERCETLGDTVGYHIRFEQRTSNNTVLLYCTSGVLLRMLTDDEDAQAITHIVLDEIHEREMNTDYLLIALRQAVHRRPDLKVILMSATMGGNLDIFRSYFEHRSVVHVDVPSRLYPVRSFFLGELLALTGYRPPPVIPDCAETVDDVNALPVFHTDFWRGPAQQAWEQLDSRLKFMSAIPFVCGFESQRAEETLAALSDEDFATLSLLYDQAIHMNFDKTGINLDLVLTAIRYCMSSPIPGSILVFLPGIESINAVRGMVESLYVHGPIDDCHLMPFLLALHSQLNIKDQQHVFNKPPKHCRKVILSTNIAEASLTIDDVVFVIDSGLAKEKRYEHYSRISQLVVGPIARSNADQRAGRAGRCREGFCFRLYSKEAYQEMAQVQLAEMLRSSIHEVCLHAKLFAPSHHTVRSFLALAPEPPKPEHIDQAMAHLEKLGALQSLGTPSTDESGVADSAMAPSIGPSRMLRAHTQPLKSPIMPDSALLNGDAENKENSEPDVFAAAGSEPVEPSLTHLGRLIAHLPLEPSLARLLYMGVALRCLEPVVTLVAVLSYRDPFLVALGDTRALTLHVRNEMHGGDLSDHLTLVRVYHGVYHSRPEGMSISDACARLCVSAPTMRMMSNVRRQLLRELRRAKIVPADWALGDTSQQRVSDPRLNAYSHIWSVVLGAITAGSYPNVAYVKNGNLRRCRVAYNPDTELTPHPSSCLRRSSQTLKKSHSSAPLLEFLVFNELAQLDEGTAMRTVSAVPPVAVALFGGSFRLPADQMRESIDLAHNFHAYEMPNKESDEDDRRVHERAIYVDDCFLLRASPMTVAVVQSIRIRLTRYFLDFVRSPISTIISSDYEELLRVAARMLQRNFEMTRLPTPSDWAVMFPAGGIARPVEAEPTTDGLESC